MELTHLGGIQHPPGVLVTAWCQATLTREGRSTAGCPWSPTSSLLSSRNAMWHLEIKKGQLEDVRKSSYEETEARDRCLQAHAAQQLCREEEASRKMERNRRLRVQ